jgi:hypothetical protein
MALDEKKYNEVVKIFTAYLETNQLRKTPERFAILEEIYTRDGHFDVDAEWQGDRERDRVTVGDFDLLPEVV